MERHTNITLEHTSFCLSDQKQRQKNCSYSQGQHTSHLSSAQANTTDLDKHCFSFLFISVNQVFFLKFQKGFKKSKLIMLQTQKNTLLFQWKDWNNNIFSIENVQESWTHSSQGTPALFMNQTDNWSRPCTVYKVKQNKKITESLDF